MRLTIAVALAVTCLNACWAQPDLSAERAQVTGALTQALGFAATLQRGGGWPQCNSWPDTSQGYWSQGSAYPMPPNQAVINVQVTPDLAVWYLRAYELTHESSFLQVARRAGDMFVQAQSTEGGFTSTVEFDASGVSRPVDSINIMDGTTQTPIVFLAYLYRVTGAYKYWRAAQQGANFLLAAQLPNGAWSRAWPHSVSDNIGCQMNGMLNNDATSYSAMVMTAWYAITGQPTYRDAVIRAGDWLVGVQTHGPTHAWAQQYDSSEKPCWWRAYEPPAIGMDATAAAAGLLCDVYELTGDSKYLQAAREAVTWLETIRQDKGWPRYLDPATGDPVSADEYKLYHSVSVPNTQLAWYSMVSDYGLGAQLERVQSFATARPPFSSLRPALTASQLTARWASLKPGIEKIIASMDPRGAWPTVSHAYDPNFPASVRASDTRILELIDALEVLDAMAGTAKQPYRGPSAYPGYPDWVWPGLDFFSAHR